MFKIHDGALPRVPVVRIGPDEDAALALLQHSPESAQRLLAEARGRYTRLALRLLDRPSRRWLLRNTTCYRASMLAAEQALLLTGGAAGFWTMNASYEWACTAGIAGGPGGAPLHLRVLDWDTPGLGRELQAVVSGDVMLLTWAGFAGCVTGMRAGAFSLALNQPPLPGPAMGPGLHLASQGFGWVRTRAPRWASTAMPPSHLVRHVLERCTTAEAALALIERTPVSAGAILSMAGVRPGEGWLIEKEVDRFAVHVGEGLACANHWPSDAAAIARRPGSKERSEHMRGLLRDPALLAALGWLGPPVLVDETRVACVMNPREGTMLAQGFEAGAAVTGVTAISR